MIKNREKMKKKKKTKNEKCEKLCFLSDQALLVRWILLVYDVMDSHDQLHGLYGVLFYFLENETMVGITTLSLCS